jgi:hypothetical protein
MAGGPPGSPGRDKGPYPAAKRTLAINTETVEKALSRFLYEVRGKVASPFGPQSKISYLGMVKRPLKVRQECQLSFFDNLTTNRLSKRGDGNQRLPYRNLSIPSRAESSDQPPNT